MALSEEDKAEEKKLLRKTLLSCAIGSSCFISASFSLSGLQSSINLRESLGTTCMAIRLATAALGSLVVSPFFVKKYGPKRGLIVSELLDIVFTAANFYPSWYTMPLAAAISGFGSSMIWVAGESVLQSVAKRSSQGKDVAIETQKLSGIYFSILALGQMASNGLTQLILRFSFMEPRIAEDPVFRAQVESATGVYGNSSHGDATNISACGSRDCPAEYVYLKHSSKFQLFSPNENAVYLLLSVYLVLQSTAVLIHSVLLPAIPPLDEELNEDFSDDGGIAKSSSRENLLPRKKSIWTYMVRSVQGVFLFLLSPAGLLTFPIQLLFGLSVSFVWAEFNRAFVSCVIGVEEVGACSFIVGLLNLLSSIAISRIAPRFGLISIMITGMLLDVANYTASLLWVPSNATLFLPYIFSAFHGISHGIRRNMSFLIASRYSRDNAIAFSAQSITICIGEIVSFAWSTPLCVYVKMYVLIALVVFATTCWGIAEHRLTRLAKSTS